jgi:hypothetical protein
LILIYENTKKNINLKQIKIIKKKTFLKDGANQSIQRDSLPSNAADN